MWRSATIWSPLRSKRAMISPVRPRAKASGLTRISVRSICVPPCSSCRSRSASGRTARAPHSRFAGRLGRGHRRGAELIVLLADRLAVERRAPGLRQRALQRIPRRPRTTGSHLLQPVLHRRHAPAARAARRARPRHLGLAVGTERPGPVERTRAVRTALLQLAQAARAADEVALDAVVAVRAQPAVELVQARLG